MTTWSRSSRAADGRHALGASSPAGDLGTYSARPAAYSRAQPLRRHQAPGRVLPGQRLVVAGDGFEPSKATPTGFTDRWQRCHGLRICGWLLDFASHSPRDRALPEVWAKATATSLRPKSAGRGCLGQVRPLDRGWPHAPSDVQD